MNKKFLVGALSLILLIGIILSTARSLLKTEQNLIDAAGDQAAPAMVTEPAPVLVNSPRFDQVAEVLRNSPTGRKLLGLKEVYNVTVQFEEGRGSRFRKGSNLILLDSRHDPVRAALYFAHEMTHAQAFHEGKEADPNSQSRQTYVNHELQEEVDGMMAGFQVKMELDQAGVRVSYIQLPLETIYAKAYRNDTEQARSLDNTLNEQQLDTLGQAAGEQAVSDAFASGEVKTSNTNDPYTDYYGQKWDEANPGESLG